MCSNSENLSEQEIILLVFLAWKTDHQLLKNLYEHPGSTRTKLASDLQLSPSTISWRMGRFSPQQLITIQKHGKELLYELTPETTTSYQRILG